MSSFICVCSWLIRASQVAVVVKNLPSSLLVVKNVGNIRDGFNPWVEKIPWRRAGQPTPVFLPGESHGQRSLVGYSPCGQTVTHDWSDFSTHVRTADSSCCTAETNTTLWCSYPLIKGKRCYGLQSVVFAVEQRGKKANMPSPQLALWYMCYMHRSGVPNLGIALGPLG